VANIYDKSGHLARTGAPTYSPWIENVYLVRET
jgi:hypothetical protein